MEFDFFVIYRKFMHWFRLYTNFFFFQGRIIFLISKGQKKQWRVVYPCVQPRQILQLLKNKGVTSINNSGGNPRTQLVHNRVYSTANVSDFPFGKQVELSRNRSNNLMDFPFHTSRVKLDLFGHNMRRICHQYYIRIASLLSLQDTKACRFSLCF